MRNVNINYIIPADGVGSVCLALLSDPFGHAPIKYARVDIDWSVVDEISLERLEV